MRTAHMPCRNAIQFLPNDRELEFEPGSSCRLQCSASCHRQQCKAHFLHLLAWGVALGWVGVGVEVAQGYLSLPSGSERVRNPWRA